MQKWSENGQNGRKNENIKNLTLLFFWTTMNSISANLGFLAQKLRMLLRFSEMEFKVEISHTNPYKIKNGNVNKMKTDKDS